MTLGVGKPCVVHVHRKNHVVPIRIALINNPVMHNREVLSSIERREAVRAGCSVGYGLPAKAPSRRR